MTSLHITAEPGLPFIDIVREFAAPPTLLLRAYTEPELVAQWLGPRRLSMQVEEYEARHGGRWRYLQREPDGTAYGFRGVFHGDPSVEDGLLQTFEFDGAPGHVSLDRLRFVPTPTGTRVETHSTFESVAARDAMVESGMARGIAEAFERLDELLPTLDARDRA
jgi:uncharacterized protein YndB with AHSA1/START domain